MVSLIKMTNEDYNHYIKNAIIEYANENVRAGTWGENEAQKLSEATFQKLLPDGVNSQGQYLFAIYDIESETKIGYLWFQIIEKLTGKEAFIFDFKLFEDFQGKGFGTESIHSLEEKAKSLGVEKMMLHVFAHNKTAISLYEKTGFQPVGIHMSKNNEKKITL